MLKLKDNLNFVLREIDSNGLTTEYNTILDESLNPDLKTKCKLIFNFIVNIVQRIERTKGVNDSYVYYG